MDAREREHSHLFTSTASQRPWEVDRSTNRSEPTGIQGLRRPPGTAGWGREEKHSGAEARHELGPTAHNRLWNTRQNVLPAIETDAAYPEHQYSKNFNSKDEFVREDSHQGAPSKRSRFEEEHRERNVRQRTTSPYEQNPVPEPTRMFIEVARP